MVSQGVGEGSLFLFFGWFRKAEGEGSDFPFVSGAHQDLPDHLRGLNLTYHSSTSWKEDYFQCLARPPFPKRHRIRCSSSIAGKV